MDDFKLRDDETLLLRDDEAILFPEGNIGIKRQVSLILTDRNIYILFRSVWKKFAETMQIPLDSITVFDGLPQVYVRSVLGLEHHLIITTKSQAYDFWMASMKKANTQRWVDYINKIIVENMQGHTVPIEKSQSANSDNNSELDNDEPAISFDIDLDNIDDTPDADIDTEQVADGCSLEEGVEEIKRTGFFADALTDTKSKEYKTTGYVIKFEKNFRHNSWKVYDNEGACIYKIKRAIVAMRPCLRIYDNRKKEYVAEIKKHINILPHVYDSFVWIVQGETLGIVTLNFTGKLLDQNYNADFLGWTYKVRPTKNYEMLKGSTVIAKPLSTKGADPEPFEYYDLNDELGIVMMFYTNYLDNHESRSSLGDRILGG